MTVRGKREPEEHRTFLLHGQFPDYTQVLPDLYVCRIPELNTEPRLMSTTEKTINQKPFIYTANHFEKLFCLSHSKSSESIIILHPGQRIKPDKT